MATWKWNRKKLLEISKQIYDKNHSLSIGTWKKEIGHYPNGSVVREFGSLVNLEQQFYEEIKVSPDKTINLRKPNLKKLKALELIGNKCFVCGSEKNIRFHEKNGKHHNWKNGLFNRWRALDYYISNHINFIPLCSKHHSMIHELTRTKDSNLFKLFVLVGKLR